MRLRIRIHQMARVDPFTLAFTSLQPDEIFAAVDELGYRCNGRFLALNSYENRVYKLGQEHGEDIVVKFYRPGRWSDEAILEEHRFAIELAAQDIPVVPPLAVGGTSLFRSGPFRLAIYPCRGGRAPDLDNYDLQRQLGRLVARIHSVGATAAFDHRPRIDIDRYGHDSIEYLLEEGFIPDEMCDVYEGTANLVIEGVENCFERAGQVAEIRLHGDFHPGNVLVAGDALHIVDLDDARTGPAAQDLWMFLSGDREEQTPQLAAILDGYQEFRRFDATELHLVEALRSLRLLHYSAWLARRWDDPAFRQAFPWFNTRRYWDEQVLSLREQVALMQEPPLAWRED